MDDLIKDIQERTGLSAEKVLEVVTMVTEYLKNALPDELVDQVTKYLGMAAEAASGATGSAKATASSAAETSGMSDMVGKAAGMASSALSKASDMLSGFAKDHADGADTPDEDAGADE